MLLNMDVRGANGYRIWPIKNESKNDFFTSDDAQESKWNNDKCV